MIDINKSGVNRGKFERKEDFTPIIISQVNNYVHITWNIYFCGGSVWNFRKKMN